MIYFMQPLDGGPVKIGFSGDVEARRKQLETHYSEPLAVLATMEGGPDEERAIHSRFGHLRLGRTEQFRPAADLMAYIGRPLLVGPNPDAVEAMEPALARLPADVVTLAKLICILSPPGLDIGQVIGDACRAALKKRADELYKASRL